MGNKDPKRRVPHLRRVFVFVAKVGQLHLSTALYSFSANQALTQAARQLPGTRISFSRFRVCAIS